MDNLFSCPKCGRSFDTRRGRASHMGLLCFGGTWHERFWIKVDRSAGLFECWPWIAELSGGYGLFRRSEGARHEKASRLAYELLVGPIPDGLVLDHLCRNRACVNPAHLEPVTPLENNIRGVGPSSAQTHCKNGHEFTSQNTYRHLDKRICRTCNNAATARYRARRKAA